MRFCQRTEQKIQESMEAAPYWMPPVASCKQVELSNELENRCGQIPLN
jgi:hypothetical protein